MVDVVEDTPQSENKPYPEKTKKNEDFRARKTWNKLTPNEFNDMRPSLADNVGSTGGADKSQPENPNPSEGETTHDRAKKQKQELKAWSDLDNWRDWRGGLPPDVLGTIPTGFQKALDKMVVYREEVDKVEPQPDRMAVVISAWEAGDVLPQTIKETVQQMQEAGKWGEIFVVLNNGGGKSTRDCIYGKDKNVSLVDAEEAVQDRVSQKLCKSTGADNVVFGETIELPTNFGFMELSGERIQDTSNIDTVARPIKFTVSGGLNALKEGEISLVVVDQVAEGEHNQGKIRALRDLYHKLFLETKYGGYCPEIVEMEDAETRLLMVQEGEIVTGKPAGLEEMLRLSQNGKVWVGARNALVPYDEKGDPDWKASVPPMQTSTNLIHGTKGMEWLGGGEMIGDYRGVLAMNEVIPQEYPGLRVEDVLLTVCARVFMKETVVSRDVVHTNRCPSVKEEKKAMDQMLRWIKGVKGLESIIGPELNKIHTDVGFWQSITKNIQETLRRKGKVNIVTLLRGARPYAHVVKEAGRKPDRLIGTGSKAGW